MKVRNNHKEQVKSYLRSDIQSSITNLFHESNEVQQVLSRLIQTIAGLPSVKDQELMGQAQKSLQHLSNALTQLHQARNLVNGLDTTEEVPDE